jgi:hypothetical protein
MVSNTVLHLAWLLLEDNDQAEYSHRADEPGCGLVPLKSFRFDGGGVFLHFVENLQMRSPSGEVEHSVWAGALGNNVT